MSRDPREGDVQGGNLDPETERRPRRRVEIVVPTTERWKVGEVVRTPDSDGTAPRVIRVRASRRHEANIEPPAPAPRPRDEAPGPRGEASELSPTEGRSGLVVDEALSALLREHADLGALRPDTERIAGAFGRLTDQDRERWLGMRNGRPRPVRVVGRLDAEAIADALRAAAEAAATPVDRLAAERALLLLEQDPQHLWNLALEAVLPTRVEECASSPAGLAALLPPEGPCSLDLPPELAVALLPSTAAWRVERVCGVQDADDRLVAQLRQRARAFVGPAMRKALCELAAATGNRAPAPADDEAWEEVLLYCLRQLCESRSPALATAAQRPAELSAYIGVGRSMLEAGRPCMADVAFTAALAVTSDPSKVLRHQAEARAMLEQKISVLASGRTDAGFGAVVRPAGPETQWVFRWEANATWPDEASVARIGLPAELSAALASEGLDTVGALRAADPLTLLAVAGVGRAGLRQIQAALGAPPQ